MNTSLDDKVRVDLPTSVCLVFFELLTQSYEAWRVNNPDDSSAGTLCVEAREFAQRKALWRLEGELERALPELFSSNYPELLSGAKRLLEMR
jgi:hypothetical protein